MKFFLKTYGGGWLLYSRTMESLAEAMVGE